MVVAMYLSTTPYDSLNDSANLQCILLSQESARKVTSGLLLDASPSKEETLEDERKRQGSTWEDTHDTGHEGE